MKKQQFRETRKQQQSMDLGKGNYKFKSKKHVPATEYTIKKSARITRAPK